MTERVTKNLNLLKALTKCTDVEKKDFVKIARPEVINAICDCILNILNGNVPISSKQKEKLRTKKNILRKLVLKKTNTPKRKKLLVQHGNGILTSILGPAIRALASL